MLLHPLAAGGGPARSEGLIRDTSCVALAAAAFPLGNVCRDVVEGLPGPSGGSFKLQVGNIPSAKKTSLRFSS